MLTKVVLIWLVLGGLIEAQAVEEKYFQQKLDHFNGNPGTWKQRYLESREFYRYGGPILIMLGGPGFTSVVPAALQKGSMVDYAKQQGAYLFAIEARYYGKSRPTSDVSTENLMKFLSFPQEIADFTAIIRMIRSRSYFLHSKVVGFGVSYMGNKLLDLMKYHPGLIDIGVASSVTIVGKFEIPEFMEKGLEVTRRINPLCPAVMRDGVLCLVKIIRGETCQNHNLRDLPNLLNLCDDVDIEDFSPLDVGGLVSEMIRTLGGVMLLNNPDPSFPYNLEKLCASLTDPNNRKESFERLALEVKRITKIRKLPCIDPRFQETVLRLRNTSWSSSGVRNGEKPITFLRCNEGGVIKTPDTFRIGERSTKLAIAHFLAICEQVFNISEETVRANAEIVTKITSSRMIPSQCTIFVSGQDDLYSYDAVTSQEEAGNCNRAIVIEGASFARDKIAIPDEGKSYPPALRKAQLEIGNLINKWLKTGNCCLSGANAVNITAQIFS